MLSFVISIWLWCVTIPSALQRATKHFLLQFHYGVIAFVHHCLNAVFSRGSCYKICIYLFVFKLCLHNVEHVNLKANLQCGRFATCTTTTTHSNHGTSYLFHLLLILYSTPPPPPYAITPSTGSNWSHQRDGRSSEGCEFSVHVHLSH